VKAEDPPEAVEAIVILPGVVVVMVMFAPATRFEIPQVVPWEVKSCPATVGAVVVAVPPFAIGRTPVKLICGVNPPVEDMLPVPETAVTKVPEA